MSRCPFSPPHGVGFALCISGLKSAAAVTSKSAIPTCPALTGDVQRLGFEAVRPGGIGASFKQQADKIGVAHLGGVENQGGASARAALTVARCCNRNSTMSACWPYTAECSGVPVIIGGVRFAPCSKSSATAFSFPARAAGGAASAHLAGQLDQIMVRREQGR